MKHARSLAFVWFVLMILLLAGMGTDAVAQPAPTQDPAEDVPRAPKPPRDRSETHLFQITMVLARSDETTSERDGSIPTAAQKALDDLRDFLPYESYELLDSVLLRTSRHAQTAMRGPEGRELQVHLTFRQSGPGDANDFIVENFTLVDRSDLWKKVEGKETMLAGSTREIIATSFGMNAGETLVVGSSRLNGGETALVLIVSAIPDTGGASR